MVKQEHLDMLKQGTERWNQWRGEHPEIHPHLPEADLHGVNLSEANFRGADLYWARLNETDLSRADLQGANLSGADLSRANLSEANLSGADLRGANAFKANLRGANLSGADLRGANLTDTHLLEIQHNSRDITHTIGPNQEPPSLTAKMVAHSPSPLSQDSALKGSLLSDQTLVLKDRRRSIRTNVNRQFKQTKSVQGSNHALDPETKLHSITEQDTAELQTLSSSNGTVSKVSDIAKQGTVELPALPSGSRIVSSFPYTVWDNLQRPVQHLFTAVLDRARDSAPEVYHARSKNKVGERAINVGWLPLLTLASAMGIALIAYGFASSRGGGAGLRTFLYLGVILIYTPIAVRLVTPSASRTERIGLLSIAGICCYIVKVITSPLYFASFDEFLHWRTVDDIARSGHIPIINPMLPVSPFYPGLEIVTNALNALTGLNTFESGLIVIGVARLLMVLALFALNEQISKSARMASIATILYIANSQFLLFDAQYAYESLALPLATLILVIMAPYQAIAVRLTSLEATASSRKSTMIVRTRLKRELRWITLAAWGILIALVLSHHVTDFFFDGLLLLWAVVYGILRLTPIYRSHLLWTALLATGMSIAYALRAGNPVINYLSSFIGQAMNELSGLITGTGTARQLFSSYAGSPTPLFERVISFSSVGLITFCLPFAWLCLWKRYRSNALTCSFGIMSIFYPILQVFRFTTTGEGLTDRSTSLLFIPITCMLAIFIVQFWPTHRLNWKQYSLLSSAMTVVFLGGIILGAGPGLSLLPGPYAVAADIRSIEPEGIQAAIWAGSHLGPNNRIGTDYTNEVLMGTFGDQYPVTTDNGNIDVSPIFFSTHLGPNELSILRSDQIHYLVVDMRLSQSLPMSGIYFDQEEAHAYDHASRIALRALQKFNAISQINRVFDGGDIVIYDTGGLINARKTP